MIIQCINNSIPILQQRKKPKSSKAMMNGKQIAVEVKEGEAVPPEALVAGEIFAKLAEGSTALMDERVRLMKVVSKKTEPLQALGPEARAERVRQAIMNDPHFKDLIGDEEIISISPDKENEGHWSVVTETRIIDVYVHYDEMPPEWVGPGSFALDFEVRVLNNRPQEYGNLANVLSDLLYYKIIRDDEPILTVSQCGDSWLIVTNTHSISVVRDEEAGKYIFNVSAFGPETRAHLDELVSRRTFACNDSFEITRLINDPQVRPLIENQSIELIRKIGDNFIIIAGGKCIPVIVKPEKGDFSFELHKVATIAPFDLEDFEEIDKILSHPKTLEVLGSQKAQNIEKTEEGWRIFTDNEIYDISVTHDANAEITNLDFIRVL